MNCCFRRVNCVAANYVNQSQTTGNFHKYERILVPFGKYIFISVF